MIISFFLLFTTYWKCVFAYMCVCVCFWHFDTSILVSILVFDSCVVCFNSYSLNIYFQYLNKYILSFISFSMLGLFTYLSPNKTPNIFIKLLKKKYLDIHKIFILSVFNLKRFLPHSIHFKTWYILSLFFNHEKF